MGVKILNRQYIDAFEPGASRSWLLGNVADWKRARFLIEAGVEYIASQTEPIAINITEKTLKLMNGKKWSDYGFGVYGEVTVNYIRETTDAEGNVTTTPVDFTFNILQMYNDTIVYDTNSGWGVVGYDIIPTERATEKIYGVKLFRVSDMQGVRVRYNNTSNSNVPSHDLTSFIDGNITEGYGQIDNASTVELELLGHQSGMAVSRMTVSPAYGSDTAGAVNAAWNITGETSNMLFNASNTNFVDIAPKANRNSYSIPAEDTTKSVIKTNVPVSGSGYANGLSNSCFIYNSTINELLYFYLDINLTAVNTTNEADPIYIRLVLIKYDNGAALNFVEKIVIKEWEQEHAATNVALQYNNITPIGVEEGVSYAFAIEFSSGAIGQNINRKLDYKINSGSYSVSQSLGGGEDYKKRYWVEIDYMLASFFDSLETFETMQAPEVVFEAESLADVITIDIYPEWNNPNIAMKTNPAETELLGNTGWFFENYNGLPNPFSVKELKYSDLLDASLVALSYGQEVKVRAVITGYQNPLVPGSTSVQYGYMWVPNDEDEYKQKLTPFHKNTKVNSPELQEFVLGSTTGGTLVYEGFTAIEGERMDVKNISISQVDNDLVFEAIFMPTAAFMDFFDAKPDDRSYILWLSVADTNLETGNRVTLLLDFNEMEFFIPISGELPGVTNRFIEHPEGEDVPGVDVYDGFLEDDVLARANFKLDIGQRLDRMIMGYEVENTTTGATYELDRFTANLQTFITNNAGRQELNFDGTRGYKLEPGNNKNWVKVVRDDINDTADYSSYEAYFAAKIRWEDWIQRQNVPVDFYNNQLPFNGSENNWLDYLRAGNNHQVNFFILFDVNEGGTVNRYKNVFNIEFQGYDENTNIITTEHNYSGFNSGANLNIGTDPETGRPLGVLVNNDYTLIEIAYTKVNGEAWDLNNVYAVTTIEIDKGAGVLEHRQLSSVWGSENDNILIPLPGLTRLGLEVSGGQPNKIITSCLVDYTRLSPAEKYKITGRIGCFRNENGVPILEKVYDENEYSNEYE